MRFPFPASLTALAVLAAACSGGAGDEPAIATVPTISVPADAATPSGDQSSTPELPPDTPGDPTVATVSAKVIAEVVEPISGVVAPNGEYWLAQRSGRVVVFDPTTGAVGTTILDLTDKTIADGEQGLLSIAVDSDNLYVDYTDPVGHSHIDAHPLDAQGRPGEQVTFLTQRQLFANHNGGGMEIGPDGYLYIGFGDGGGSGDPRSMAQDTSTMLGSIIRVKPSVGADSPYTIPADNPFADGREGAPEIFITGTRNPWRFTFDPATGDLWIADVGQDKYEEVDLLLAANGSGRGANLGWNHREGLHRFDGSNSADFTDPIFEYEHGGDPGGCSVTGGVVYRGSAIPALEGAYLFGDFCTSRLWALSISDGAVVFTDLGLEIPGGQLASFAVDQDGEVLMLSLSGQVSRLVDPNMSTAVPDPAGRTYPDVGSDPSAVADRLIEIEQSLRTVDPSESNFADLAHEQQVIYRTIGHNPDWVPIVMATVPDNLRASVQLEIDARISIGEISNAQPAQTMPAWEIIAPLSAEELLAIYQQAEADTGISWSYLAAINMVETGFGRIVGLSTAGAQGPMQFMPATWAEVGTGSIDNPHDAIPAAARYLVRRGGPTNMVKAVRGYNNSAAYVAAVTSYAQLFASDSDAFRAAHDWEIHYASAAGDLWLPVGYRYPERIPLEQYLDEAPWSMPPEASN